MLRERIEAALRRARETGDRRAAATLRLVLAALDERERRAQEEGAAAEVADADIEALLRQMIAQRKADIARCEAAARLEEADREREEIAVLERFLPPQLDDQRLRAAVEEAIRELGAASLKDCGRVLAVLKQRYNGQFDLARAKKLICARLG